MIAKYGTVFRIALAERMVYRFDFFLSTFLRFVPIITTIVLWRAIYDGADTEEVGGLSYNSMVSYYLLVMVSRAFGSMPGLASGIASDVRDGDLRKFLLQPIHYPVYLIVLRAAHKIVYYVTAAVPFAIVFWMCRSYLPEWPTLQHFVAYVLSLVLSFALGFTFHCFVGMLSFWFLEVSSLLYIVMIAQYFLSGHMFPLSLLPDTLRTIVSWMPFAYETYYPTLIGLQTLTGAEAWWVIAVQVGWITVLGTLTLVAWRRGLRRYAAFGG